LRKIAVAQFLGKMTDDQEHQFDLDEYNINNEID